MLLDCYNGVETKISLDTLRFLNRILRIPESGEQQFKGISAPYLGVSVSLSLGPFQLGL